MTGLNLKLELEQQSSEDWLFKGITSQQCFAQIPADLRHIYLPKGELQNVGDDKMDCATRAILNILEAKLNYLYKTGKTIHRAWLKDNLVQDGEIILSDRFIAITSGTTRDGNSLKAPLEAVRKFGVIPKSMFPQVNSFDEYYSGVTSEMLELGKEFLKRFSINYDKVYEEFYKELLNDDMLDVALFAWSHPVNGVYPRVEYTPNHACVLFDAWFAFDNYYDYDGDFIKELAPDYSYLKYGYRLFLTEHQVKRSSFLQAIINYIKWIFK